MSLKVKIFEAKGTQVLQVNKSALTIGSASHCDVVLDHPSVHPEHARAWLEGGRIWVQDLGGENGTSLNEIRLPSLKPMLVRELDILRLGKCEATLGVEPNLVRAPVVKSTPAAGVASAPVLDSSEKNALKDTETAQRKSDLEKLGRELADLRLQLQMARLEKNSNQELASQLQNLKDEVKGAQEQKLKWAETLKQVESERQQQRKSREVELKELKARLEREALDQRTRDQHQSENEKRDSVTEMAKQMRAISSTLVKRWATRPLSQDMIFEWEGELMQIFHKVLLKGGAVALMPELPPLPKTPPVPNEDKSEPHIQRREVRSAEGDLDATRVVSAKLPLRKLQVPWRNVALGVGSVVILVALFWVGKSYLHRPGSSVQASRAAVVGLKRAPAARYAPKTSRKYRASYTDNVLYLENYVEAEENIDFRKRWTAELKKAAIGDWKMDEQSVLPILGKEQGLIQDLNRLKNAISVEKEQEGIRQMRLRENAYQHDLEVLFKKRTSIDRFLRFKRAFYERNQAYLSKE